MNWINYDASKAESMPKKAGQYLTATLMDDDQWCYTVCDFYMKGDNIILNTPSYKMPDFIRNKSIEERLLWSIFHDCFTCPEDGFYCTEDGECWELTKIDKWCEIIPPVEVVREGLCG